MQLTGEVLSDLQRRFLRVQIFSISKMIFLLPCSLREYLQVLAIIAGTATLSMGKKVGSTALVFTVLPSVSAKLTIRLCRNHPEMMIQAHLVLCSYC